MIAKQMPYAAFEPMKTASAVDPDYLCPLCPRLVALRDHWKALEPAWHNGPVDSWVPSEAIGGTNSVKLLIIGMAPGLRGANRTGRPFTGDYAGDLLYSTLLKFGYAKGEYRAAPDDGMQLVEAAITNAVRCVPPENKPIGEEVNNCRPFLEATLARFPNLQALVTLGKISHDTTIRTLGGRVSANRFSHRGSHTIGQFQVFSSYHCSRYNTNTGRLTTQMFEDVFRDVKAFLD